MCQGCVDEGFIAQWVYDIKERFNDEWHGSHSPAHIVLADDNVRDYDIQGCLDGWDEWEREWGVEAPGSYWDGVDPTHYIERAEAIKNFLRYLLTIPEKIRCPNPEG